MAEIVNGEGITKTHANVHRSRSKFPLKQVKMQGHRFGEYHPFLCFDGVTSDSLPWRSAHNARSYTLKAPLMQDVHMNKDYFAVYLRSVLPFQADRVITNPPLGSDVPSDAYTNISDFNSKIIGLAGLLMTEVQSYLSGTPNYQLAYTAFWKFMVFLESVYSNGSVLSSLGCNLAECISVTDYTGKIYGNKDGFFDGFFDAVCSWFIANQTGTIQVQIDGKSYILSLTDIDPKTAGTISFNNFLMRIRDTSDWKFTSGVVAGSSVTISSFIGGSFDFQFAGLQDIDLDICPLWAYNLVCAEFYTDDKIDYVYSADLYRQYIHDLTSQSLALIPSQTDISFNYNGLNCPYDYLSAKYFNEVYNGCLNTTQELDKFALQYFLSLFGFKRSLRYKDYFTGSRTRPLAVGDVNAPVVGGNVSVVDVSRKIQIQRYLNAVQSTGRKFEEYLKGIFGVAPAPDHHNPVFLARTTDSLFASQVENTGDAQQTQQNSVTAVFRGNGGQYEFTVDIPEPCIIIGLASYDIERLYSHGIDRRFFIKDRFDMFLPELQFVGDQPIYQSELSAKFGGTDPFSYTGRDMDRKLMVNHAEGPFAANVLPGYAFVFDPASEMSYMSASDGHISPDFIRSKPCELDSYYLALTGHSLGTYFHFIVVICNTCVASRPMAVNPQILG